MPLRAPETGGGEGDKSPNSFTPLTPVISSVPAEATLTLDAQSLVWFGISGGAAIFAGSLLYQRYVKREVRAVESRCSFTLFAILMVCFAAAAFLVGLLTAST